MFDSRKIIIAVLCMAIVCLCTVMVIYKMHKPDITYTSSTPESVDVNGEFDTVASFSYDSNYNDDQKLSLLQNMSLDSYDGIPKDTPEEAILRNIEHPEPENETKEQWVQRVYRADGSFDQYVFGFTNADRDRYDNPYIYRLNQSYEIDQIKLKKAIDDLDSDNSEKSIKSNALYKQSIDQHKRDKRGASCDEHEFVEDENITIRVNPSFDDSPYHIAYHKPICFCQNCGELRLNESSYDLIPHTFDGWYLMPDVDEHIGSVHRFTYFSHCNVCRQYCWKIIELPCDGNGRCITASEYIEGDIEM